MQKSNIVVIGMPGSGKSTLGKLIAQNRGLSFVDTDSLIEARENMGLQDIVNRRGVKCLRTIEADVIQKLDLENHVISTGGSAIYSDAAMRNLSLQGVILYLRISLPTLLKRITNGESRGLAKMKSHSLPRLYFEREHMYAAAADIFFDNDWPLTALTKASMLAYLDCYYRRVCAATDLTSRCL